MFKRHALILGLILAVTIHAYDELVLAIAMPAITKDLEGFDWYGLAFSSYLLSTLFGVVWAGQDTDKRGPLRVFMFGYCAFGLGLVIAGSAQSMEALIIGRLLQGLGGGISWTVAFAVINLAFAPTERPKMIAMLDAAWVLPSLAAPLIGGLFIDYLHWRWIFFTQIPVLAVVGVLLYPHLVKLQKSTNAPIENKLAVALRLIILLSLVLYIGNQALSWLWLLFIPALLLSTKPFLTLMPTGFAQMKTPLSIILMIHAFVFACFYGVEIFFPVLTTDIFKQSALQTGLFIGVGACTWCAASLLQARLSRSYSVVQSLVLGFVVFLTGLASLIYVNVLTADSHWLYFSMGACGFGMGVAFNTCVSAAMDITAEGSEGATSTALGIMSSLSIALASGLGGAILNVGSRQGYALDHTLLSIWLLVGLGAIFTLAILVPRYRQRQTL